MMPWFTRQFGNPASRSHVYGWKASEAVEMAREQVAGLLRVNSKDIIFVSGATEGLNMAIKGLAEASVMIGKHIVAVSTEHHAVLDPLHWLQRRGYEVTLIQTDHEGVVDPDQIKQAIRNDTIMVIVMWANNETGVIQDMRAIGAICQEAGIPLISDATQAVGKIPVNPYECAVSMMACSAHKLYGPKGVGAVWLNSSRLKVKPAALIHGGGHERGFRSGTLNVPGIVGFGMAAHLSQTRLNTEGQRIRELRDSFEKRMMGRVEEVYINGHTGQRLDTVSNIRVRYVDSQSVMSRFRTKLAISSGSACSSANPEPSHVLLAMGLTPEEAKSSFRVSLGIPTTVNEIDQACQIMEEAIAEERSISPAWQMFKQGIDLT
jgi:cysteine desulfurase